MSFVLNFALLVYALSEQTGISFNSFFISSRFLIITLTSCSRFSRLAAIVCTLSGKLFVHVLYWGRAVKLARFECLSLLGLHDLALRNLSWLRSGYGDSVRTSVRFFSDRFCVRFKLFVGVNVRFCVVA